MLTDPAPPMHPKFAAAIARERRITASLDRIATLLLTHPALDPFECADLIQAVRSIDRRGF